MHKEAFRAVFCCAACQEINTWHKAATYDLKSKRLMDRSTLRGEESIA
jgi:hypothetical protein